MKQKVIIIGAGIGGLATALRLLKAGYEVVIYEKDSKVGGKVNQIKKEGYTFDLTATISMMPQEMYLLFEELGLNVEDYLEFTYSQTLYDVFFYDGTVYQFSTDLVKLNQQLLSISIEDTIGYFKLMSDIYEKYHHANQAFLSEACDEASLFFTLKNLKEAIQIMPLSSVYDYVSKYLKDEKLKQYVCFQAMYIGMSPYDSSNIYALLPGVSQFYGLPHIKGGMYHLVEVMEQLIKDWGGMIYTDTCVERLVINKKRVLGVQLKDRVDKSDYVIANAQVPYVMRELQSVKKPKDYHLSCSSFILYLGIKRKLPMLNLHNIWINKAFEENIKCAFDGRLPKEASFYFYVPSRVDETMAPTDKEAMNVIIRVPNLMSDEIEWNEQTISFLKEQVYEVLTKITNISHFKELIEVEEVLTPLDLASRFNSYKGIAFGLSHDLVQTNYFRPHHQSDEFERLYFVGDCTHPGTGISLVLKSAKQLAKQIDKHI